jgi:hypothetical protein
LSSEKLELLSNISLFQQAARPVTQIEVIAHEFSPTVKLRADDLSKEQLQSTEAGKNPVHAYHLYLNALVLGDRTSFEKYLSSKLRNSYASKNGSEIGSRFADASRWLEVLDVEITHQFLVGETAYLRVQTFGEEAGIRGESIRFIAQLALEDGLWYNADLHKVPVSKVITESFLGPRDLEENFYDGWQTDIKRDTEIGESVSVKVSVVDP